MSFMSFAAPCSPNSPMKCSLCPLQFHMSSYLQSQTLNTILQLYIIIIIIIIH